MNAITLTTGKASTFGGKKIMIQELTVAQVRKIIARVESDNESNLVDDLLDSNIPVCAIAEATGVSIEQLEHCKPSDIDALAQEVEQANPFFSGMVKRKLQTFEEMKGLLKRVKEISPKDSTAISAT